jgi:hypothetical protein
VAATFTFDLPELKIYQSRQRPIFLPPTTIEIELMAMRGRARNRPTK